MPSGQQGHALLEVQHHDRAADIRLESRHARRRGGVKAEHAFHEPKQTKGKGMLMFFTHLDTGHKGLVCAMATEPIPVRARFEKPVSSVAISFWGSTGMPALLEAFDVEGKVVDRASLESVPGRKAPGDPVPIFNMTVKASRIAYVEFSGPREGEYLAAEEVRFTPVEDDRN